MDLSTIANSIEYNGAGTLFWTTDKNGDIWVLLARRRESSILGRGYTFSIPVVSASEHETSEEAAARAAHDELGLMPVSSGAVEFWDIGEGRISMHLYAQHLSSMKKPKCRNNYIDATWICLPDDYVVEDGDILLRDELKAFRKAVLTLVQKKSGPNSIYSLAAVGALT